MNYKPMFIADLKLKILFVILLLLGACSKPLDLSEIEIGGNAENFNLDSNLFEKKKSLDYLYKIDDDTIYKKVQMIDKDTEEGATYYSYFLSDMALSKFRFGKFTPREGHVNVYNGNISTIDVSFPQEQLSEFVRYLYKTLEELPTHKRWRPTKGNIIITLNPIMQDSIPLRFLKRHFLNVWRIKILYTVLCISIGKKQRCITDWKHSLSPPLVQPRLVIT